MGQQWDLRSGLCSVHNDLMLREDSAWDEVRRSLRLRQRLTGTVAHVPKPGAIGVFVDLGLAVGGFVDVLMLPFDATRWPTVGTVAEFEIWWMDERPQIRLKPVDPAYVRDDFDTWARKMGFPAAVLSSAADAVAESDGHC